MGIDNLEEQSEASEGEMTEEQKNSQSASNADPEEKSSRMDAAKAFFRAMYAGDETATDDSVSANPEVDNRRVKELEQSLRDAEQKALESEGLYKRMAADFDNYRRRVDREREEYSNLGVRKAFEAFMPALDDLDRAMAYLNPETPADKLIESFQLVSSRIFSCLEQAGLKRIDTKGALFDPRFHEPVQQIETTEHPDGGVISELRGGYVLGDKVIRPSLVNVASNNTAPEPEAEGENKSESPSASDNSLNTEDNVYDLGNLEDLDV